MNNLHADNTNFTTRNISLKRAAEILAKNNIQANDHETSIILDFLYQIAQNHNKYEVNKKADTLAENRTC